MCGAVLFPDLSISVEALRVGGMFVNLFFLQYKYFFSTVFFYVNACLLYSLTLSILGRRITRLSQCCVGARI